MKAATVTAYVLITIVTTLGVSSIAAQSGASAKHYPTLRGPRYTVDLRSGYPEVGWDQQPAPERLVVTSDTVGFVVDDAGLPKVLLAWGASFDNLDAAYTSESYFAWALSQVSKGQPWTERRTNLRGDSKNVREEEEVVTWSGTRTVSLSNPGHELVFTITPDGATVTDNGISVAVAGGAGNYRVSSSDYEAGASVRADGYVYHYYKPLR